tara:strand:- start:210 stop:1040 length:831 start_codon:yes stop_codon:yes gene_type:complete
MKVRHNKKRNTAFVFEALIREATVAILKGDEKRKDAAIRIIKKHFHEGKLLKKDLQCYRSLYENQDLELETCEKILKEAHLQKRLIDPQGLFAQQTALIRDINKDLDSEVFNNFVPNYRTLATIDQMFSFKTSPKTKVILEQEILANMKARQDNMDNASVIDNLTYRTFVEKFNQKYESDLLEEQKSLLMHYISSFTDNALQLKIYLNEELTRLKKLLNEAKTSEVIEGDEDMLSKTEQIVERLESFSKTEITENVLMTVLKTQSLVKEIYNGDHN